PLPPWADAVVLPRAPASALLAALSLHDALPISRLDGVNDVAVVVGHVQLGGVLDDLQAADVHVGHALHALGQGLGPLELLGRIRSEEHTSELQSRENLVCRLLLEKKEQSPPTAP